MLPWFEAGIYIANIPGRNEWVEPFINEFMNFPEATYNNDQVDSLVQLLHMNLVVSRLHRPTVEAAVEV